MENKADAVFELSWEVCNKVGGIYTVLMSKAVRMMENYSDYTLIGPFFPGKKMPDFVEEEAYDELKPVFKAMQAKGLIGHFGKWLIKGRPRVVLIDFGNLRYKKDDVLSGLWNDFKIDSYGTDDEYSNPVLWSTAVGMFLEEYAREFQHKKIVAHCHEWLAGGALLYLKQNRSKVATVFTTHATMLGRSIAGGGQDLYSMLGHFDPETEARNKGVISKFTMERASARNADCFTTVSEITGIESEHILGRKPDVLLPNGLDMQNFPSYEEIAVLHREYRSKIKEMVSYYFLPYESFDIENTFIYYIFGRYEYKNKGIDVFTKSLGILNRKLKEEKSKNTIIAYYWIPAWTKGIKKELLESRAYFAEIQDAVLNQMDSMHQKLTAGVISGTDVSKIPIFTDEFIVQTRRLSSNFKRSGHAPFVTHYLDSEDNDEIIRGFKEAGLNNNPDDRVKVVFHPAYLTGTDGLLDLEYYEAMAGGHLGIFPSYYEPWGYTPLETAAWGVPAITTDFAGFGMWIKNQKQAKDKGIIVLDGFGKSYDQVVNDLAKEMYEYNKLDRKGRVERKINAKELSKLADWGELITQYVKAHSFALGKIYR
jgi:glycogen(starch) synthase